MDVDDIDHFGNRRIRQVGELIQNAILQSDYNMILGCITISILAISTATLIADLIYPFIDPRIRYS